MVNYLSKTYFFIRKLHRSRNYYERNYYYILKVDKNCSQKQIKAAYLKKCKELHPDKNPNDSTSQSKFILLTEAYEVLSKPYTRKLYDKHLENPFSSNFNPKFSQRPVHSTRREEVWRDETIWEMRDKSKDAFYENKPYYGIKGLKRMPNWYFALACCVLMAIGVLGHYLAFKYGRGRTLEILDEKNREAMNTYQQVRRQAQQLDRNGQIAKFKEKFSTSINPDEDGKK